jgi:FkbM family methyltransferase
MTQVKTVNTALSRLLYSYYKCPDFPGKYIFWRWFRNRMGYTPFVIPYGVRGWITIDERQYIQRNILQHGYYELEVWEALKPFIQQGSIIWDIGANIGSFAIRALQNEQIREIHCFEPQTEIAARLQHNININQGNAVVHQIALSDACETRKLYLGLPQSTGLASFQRDSGYGTIELQCCSIDAMVEQQNLALPNLLKIDVEGWEESVLRGAGNLLKQEPPCAIVFEANTDNHGKILNQSLVEFLTDYGYIIEHIPRPTGEIRTVENFLAHLKISK